LGSNPATEDSPDPDSSSCALAEAWARWEGEGRLVTPEAEKLILEQPVKRRIPTLGTIYERKNDENISRFVD
jgi:hypothetical protein